MNPNQQKTAQLKQIERTLRKDLNQFEGYYVKATQLDASTRLNNQLIIPVFIQIVSNSFKALQYLLRFLSDSDIMNIASTCRSAYKIIYSPLSFRLCRYLRPVVVIKHQTLQSQIPHFSQTTVDQLCSDRSLLDADQDDKMAILLTMRTNILATKQKVRQLNYIIEAYEKKNEELKSKLMYIQGLKDQERRVVSVYQDQIQKVRELLKASEGHAQSLRQEQTRMQLDRQTRALMLIQQKSKLMRQKELLIKKIKSQQKQKQQGMAYAKQVSRILSRLNQITTPGTKKPV